MTLGLNAAEDALSSSRKLVCHLLHLPQPLTAASHIVMSAVETLLTIVRSRTMVRTQECTRLQATSAARSVAASGSKQLDLLDAKAMLASHGEVLWRPALRLCPPNCRGPAVPAPGSGREDSRKRPRGTLGEP